MVKLSIKEFANVIAEKIETVRPELHTKVETINKPGGIVRTGISIKEDNVNASPIYYLEEAYDDYCAGNEDTNHFAKILLIHYQENQPNGNDIRNNFADFVSDVANNWETAKPLIKAKLLNADWNKGYLADKVCLPIDGCDLCKTYYVAVNDPDHSNVIASMPVKPEMLQAWNVTAEDLDKASAENIVLNKDTVVCPLNAFLGSLLETATGLDPYEREDMERIRNEAENSAPLWIVTSKNKTYGAVNVINDETDKGLRLALGDYYILPSSVHECIVVPQNVTGLDDLRAMVTSINATHVSPEERLSNDVFIYADGRLQIAV